MIWGLDLTEIITISISSLAIIISVWDRIANRNVNRKTNLKAEEAIRLSQGVTEIEIRNSISNARSRVDDFRLQLRNFKLERPKEDLSAHEKIFYSILEDYFNHYDRACRLYLENKIDTKSFKKEYKLEIKNIVENKNYKRYFEPKKPRFKAILKVHKRWTKNN
ncbi:hypothetical protein [Maribacter sp. 4G9]|uniref:hypothetical protein n=1 Tax=Maribacter sp. 4G9 TaxID=1889777 RepID=UPI000C14D3DD|nr:hypothetical protein [Maribacter sp. 4G9]PIB39085.1 hypothetical protein BFP75_00995 [Maribacter sp. 4G9]